jgi:hypothetical protein
MDAQRRAGFLWASPAHLYHETALNGTAARSARQGGAVAPWLAPPDPNRDGHDIDIRRVRVEVLLTRHLGPPH